eukprot:2436529-Prymnesium_polylepis.1
MIEPPPSRKIVTCFPVSTLFLSTCSVSAAISLPPRHTSFKSARVMCRCAWKDSPSGSPTSPPRSSAQNATTSGTPRLVYVWLAADEPRDSDLSIAARSSCVRTP